jgi:hypothetical protein
MSLLGTEERALKILKRAMTLASAIRAAGWRWPFFEPPI